MQNDALHHLAFTLVYSTLLCFATARPYPTLLCRLLARPHPTLLCHLLAIPCHSMPCPRATQPYFTLLRHSVTLYCISLPSHRSHNPTLQCLNPSKLFPAMPVPDVDTPYHTFAIRGCTLLHLAFALLHFSLPNYAIPWQCSKSHHYALPLPNTI